MAYTTISNVQNYLRTTYSGSTTPTDTVVSAMVSAIDAEVNRLTGTAFGGAVTDTMYFDVEGQEQNVFVPRKFPLVSVTNIYYNSGTEYSPTWTEITSKYVKGNEITVPNYYYGKNKIKLVYTYGYATTPQEVTDLATILVVEKILGSETDSNGAFSSVRIGPIQAGRSVGASRLVNVTSKKKELLRAIGSFKQISA